MRVVEQLMGVLARLPGRIARVRAKEVQALCAEFGLSATASEVNQLLGRMASGAAVDHPQPLLWEETNALTSVLGELGYQRLGIEDDGENLSWRYQPARVVLWLAREGGPSYWILPWAGPCVMHLPYGGRWEGAMDDGRPVGMWRHLDERGALVATSWRGGPQR